MFTEFFPVLYTEHQKAQGVWNKILKKVVKEVIKSFVNENDNPIQTVNIHVYCTIPNQPNSSDFSMMYSSGHLPELFIKYETPILISFFMCSNATKLLLVRSGVTQNFGRVNAHREPSQQEIYPQQLFGV
jgi:hypothetical protein